MWKIWVALGLAAIASVMSIAMGWINQARVAVILYRMLVAFAVSFCAGYAACFVAERYLVPRLLARREGEGDEGEAEEEERQTRAEPSAQAEEEGFTPLTADDLTRVSPPEQ